MKNNNPIFILGAHKSGTSLVRSILDGHSQLYVIPFEAHYFQNMKYWVDNDYRRQMPEKIQFEEMIDSFCDWIHLCNISKDTFGDSVLTGMFNEIDFRDAISSIQKATNDHERMITYFQAIHRSLEGLPLPRELRIVEKSVENAEFAMELADIFPDAKFIHIVRNPYANLVSLRRYKSIRFGYPIIRRILRTLYNSYYFLYKNKRLISDYCVINYENLVMNPRENILALCDFLDLSFEDILLKPTSRGKAWQGNSTTGKAFKFVSSEQVDTWKKDINSLEIYYINKMFPFILNDFGYETLNETANFWRPIRNENLKRYLANRFYRYYL